MDGVVKVGGWEHRCCGPSIERDQVVDLHCLLLTGLEGQLRLADTHHHDAGDAPTGERSPGELAELEVVHNDGSTRPILRVPSGTALCGAGLEDEDDGHLEDPWTGEVVLAHDPELLVTVRVPRWRMLDPPLDLPVLSPVERDRPGR